MIGGFIITGSDSKRVIIRGIGPSMTSAGVPDVISDPILRLFGPTGTQIGVNDNWQDTSQPRSKRRASRLKILGRRLCGHVVASGLHHHARQPNGLNGVGWSKSMI